MTKEYVLYVSLAGGDKPEVDWDSILSPHVEKLEVLQQGKTQIFIRADEDLITAIATSHPEIRVTDVVNYQLIRLREKTGVGLSGKDWLAWLDTDEGKELVEETFAAAGLPEVDESELEAGTYTNRRLAEMAGGLTKLLGLLVRLPGNDPASKRSILSFAVEMD